MDYQENVDKIIKDINYVFKHNCKQLVASQGRARTGCSKKIIDLIYKAYNLEKEHGGDYPIPLDMFSVLVNNLKEYDYHNQNSVYFYLLRSVASDLPKYLNEYGAEFLNILFMQIFEEQAITGIYILKPGSFLIKILNSPPYNFTDFKPPEFNELSNSVIIMMLQKLQKQSAGKKHSSKKSRTNRKRKNRKTKRARK